MERKLELATVFMERKIFLSFLQQTPRKTMKKMIGFTEAFTQESDNFMTSGLSDYDKNKIQVQVINESKYIKNTKHGEHFHAAL